MSDADMIHIYNFFGFQDGMLRLAAEHVKPYFLKPYQKKVPDGASDNLLQEWSYDLEPRNGIERPNHALANGIRKAILVTLVIKAYRMSPGVYKAQFGEASFQFTPLHEQVMEVAILFEKCCRESDIGFSSDGPLHTGTKVGQKEFLRYDSNSRKALNSFYQQAGFDNAVQATFHDCVAGLKAMYSGHSSAVALTFEMAHGLDCLRCYNKSQLDKEIFKTLTEHLGAEGCQELAIAAENLLRATGDRIMYCPSGNSVPKDVKELFVGCNREVDVCINACRAALSADSPAVVGYMLGPIPLHVEPIRELCDKFTESPFEIGVFRPYHKSNYHALVTNTTYTADSSLYLRCQLLGRSLSRAHIEPAIGSKNTREKIPGMPKPKQSITNPEEQSIYLWTREEPCLYGMINEALLMDNPEQLIKFEAFMAALNTYIKGHPADAVMKLYRGTRINTFAQGVQVEDACGPVHSGNTFRIPMYTAASDDFEKATEFGSGPLLEFIVPAGSKNCAKIPFELHHFPREREWLLLPYTPVKYVSQRFYGKRLLVTYQVLDMQTYEQNSTLPSSLFVADVAVMGVKMAVMAEAAMQKIKQKQEQMATAKQNIIERVLHEWAYWMNHVEQNMILMMDRLTVKLLHSFHKFAELHTPPTLTDDELEQLFSRIDLDKNGFISTDELKDALSKAGKDIDVVESANSIAEIMVNVMDTDGDDKISLDEFKAAFAQAPDKVLPPFVDLTDLVYMEPEDEEEEVCASRHHEPLR